jgi:flagellar basal body-associated protein FliL
MSSELATQKFIVNIATIIAIVVLVAFVLMVVFFYFLKYFVLKSDVKKAPSAKMESDLQDPVKPKRPKYVHWPEKARSYFLRVEKKN